MALGPLAISLKTATSATVLTSALGILAASWRVKHPGKRGKLMDALFIIPLVLPPTVAGYLLLIVFGRSSPVGRVLEQVGLEIVFTWPATVVAAVVVSFPLMYLAARGAFEQVNPHYLDAARTLGASEWKVWSKIALPLAWPGILAGITVSFARALGEFGATLMLAGNIPGKTQTLPIAIYFAAEAGEMRQALTWVLITLAISFASLAALNYFPGPQRFSSKHA